MKIYTTNHNDLMARMGDKSLPSNICGVGFMGTMTDEENCEIACSFEDRCPLVRCEDCILHGLENGVDADEYMQKHKVQADETV